MAERETAVTDFAKIYEIEGVGQALYVIQDGEDGPEIIFRTANEAGIEAKVTFSGYTDWDRACAAFDAIDEARAQRDSENVRRGILKCM